MGKPVKPTRHYGMDWLRVGAFSLLILYHIGMVFVPWDWHIKSSNIAEWLTIPMLGMNSWRLPLLFVVSGFASRMLVERSSSNLRFVQDRTARLLLPVLFGIVIIIPIQPWIELTTQHGYRKDFASFWIDDYFRFGSIEGVDVPTWQHLWFVVYIWTYTLCLPLVAPLFRARLQILFDRLFGNVGIIVIPLVWALFVSLWLAPGEESSHVLFPDRVGHFTYFAAFLFGVGLAGSPMAVAAAARYRYKLLLTAALAFGILLLSLPLMAGNDGASTSYRSIVLACRAVMGWTMIVALVGIAEVHLNHSHRWLPTLTQAVFPFYIVHQTAIILAAWWVSTTSLGPIAEFGIILSVTALACAGFYFIGRAIGPLRPLIGLRR